jgi:hypothetical protein
VQRAVLALVQLTAEVQPVIPGQAVQARLLVPVQAVLS